jgi:photosystem II stability/assembly factor-like uncharacterized protein
MDLAYNLVPERQEREFRSKGIDRVPGGLCMRRFVRHALYAVCLVWAGVSLLAVAQAQDQQRDPPKDFEEDGNGSFQKARMAWFYDQRAYPHATVPAGARMKAWQQMLVRLAAEQAARSRGKNDSDVGSWQLIGPATMNGYWGPNSGRVSAVAVDPTNNLIVYAGAAQGGVWKTTNGGATWTALTDTQASLAIGSIAIDPRNHLTIYVGTGEENNSGDSYYGAGILKSTDGGNTWTQYCGPFCGPVGPSGYWGGGARIGGLAVQPNNSSVVLAAVGCCATGPSGVYRSADAGQTWTQTLNVNGSQAYNVIFDPHTPATAYASVDAGGVYKSTDGGNTWVAVNGSGAAALPLSGNGRFALAMDPNTTTTLWAAVASNTNNNLAGLFKTTDAGNTWTNLPNTPDFCVGQCWYDLVVAVQPGNSNVIFAGGAQSCCGSVVQSVDGGNTWTIYSNIHPDAHAFVFTPDGSILYVGNDGGMWSTTQIASTNINWTNLNTGLATEQFYPGLSIDSNNVNIGFGGTQDNGTELYSGTTTWNVVSCGDGGVTLIDNTTNPLTVYANCIENSFYKSTNGGQNFQSAQNGINAKDRVNWTPPAALDLTNPQRLYFGTQYVYQTTNGAGLWTQISPDLTGGNGNTLQAIAVSPVNPNTVWAAAGSQVSMTQNALAGTSSTWNNVTGTQMLPPRYITAITADPQEAGTAYVTFSGFSGYGDNLGHVFMTTNAGTTWTDISGNLPNIPADDIVVDPLQANTIYAATDFGVFYTTNGGTAWATMVTGLPRVAVLSLKLHPSRNLFAATHGRSMWETNVSSVTSIPSIVGLSPPSVIAGASTFTLTVNGGAFTHAAIVQWNGADLATTYVNATQLTATVPASDVTHAGTAEVAVIIPGGSVSNPFAFTILASQLSITKSHSGNFTQGQKGPAYSVTVTNAGAGPTSGTVTATETVPAGLTLVSMIDSGSSGTPTWSCAGNTCTTGNVLAAGASYPAIAVTVNVAVSAPGQVTNQVSVSGGGPGTARASDVTTIQPLLNSDVLSETAPTGCAEPPPAISFLPTDSLAWLWFTVNYGNVGDTAIANWYAPNGSLYTSTGWSPLSSGGGGEWCFWASFNIAGAPPASESGIWSVAVSWNNSLLFTLPFTIQSASSYTISGQVTLSGSGLSGVTMTLIGSQSGAATTDGFGNYSFTVPAGGNFTVTPSLAGYTFTPPSQTFSNLSGNQTANFTAQCGSVSPLAIYLDSTSQTGPALNVTAGPGCAWSASAGGPITITSGASGTGNGTVTFTVTANSSGAVQTGTLTVAGRTVTVTQRATAEIFADVTPPAYYFDFADLMHQAGITAGCSAQPLDYCPNATTTRGEMAVFLIAAIEGGNSFAYTTTPYFTDVPPSSPYFKFIQKLKDLGITGGCTATTYCPDDAVTRGEMAVFIIASRYETTSYTYPSTPYFTDVPPSNLFFPFVQKMAQAGITAGCAPGLYCPNETLTRGQMAVFIVTGLLNELLPAGTPLIASAVPNSASPGQVVTVTLNGVNTHFVQGTTQVAAPAGVTASNITVLSGTNLTVQLAVGASVVPNPKSIVVTTGTEEAVLPNGFLVQ